MLLLPTVTLLYTPLPSPLPQGERGYAVLDRKLVRYVQRPRKFVIHSLFLGSLFCYSQAFLNNLVDSMRTNPCFFIINTLILAPTATISTYTTYLNSPDEFPEHIGLIEGRLSTGDHWGWFYGLILPFSIFMLIPAFVTFVEVIDKLFQNFQTPNATDNNRQNSQEQKSYGCCEFISDVGSLLFLGLCLFSALYKALVRSSSFMALLKQVFNLSIPVSSILALPALGSFFSDFALNISSISFAKERFKACCPLVSKNNLTRGIPILSFVFWIARHLLTLCYNLPNTALYFNAFTAFLKSIDLRDHRLGGEGSAWWEYALLTIPIAGSVVMAIATQLSYEKKLQDISAKQVKEDALDDSQKICPKLCTFVTAHAALYKAFTNSLSLISLTYSITKQLRPDMSKAILRTIGSVFAILCCTGTLLTQYSILKFDLPKKESCLGRNVLCCLFSKKTPPVDKEKYIRLHDVLLKGRVRIRRIQSVW